MKRSLSNFILFQLGWFACVLTAAWHMPWAGSLLGVGIVLYHLYASPQPRQEFLLVGAAVVIGTLWDSWLVLQGWLSYPSGQWFQPLAPHWIIMLWALFATTLNVSLRWLKQRYVLAALLGALFGPLAYYAGARLGAVMLTPADTALLALAVGWAIWLPLLMYLSRYLDGQAEVKLSRSTSPC